MSTDEYTPTTDEVRYAFVHSIAGGLHGDPGAGFDRMIEAVRADERERIAQVLREEGDKHGKGSRHLGALLHDIADSLVRDDSARIAREAGRA